MNRTMSAQWAHKQLAEIAASCFIGLHMESPALGGGYASEVSGSGYSRFKMVFLEPSSRSIVGKIPARFVGLPQSRITWVAGWDSLEQGNLLWHVELEKPVLIAAGKGYTIPEGQIIISL